MDRQRHDWLAMLRTTGEKLPAALRDSILAMGPEAIPSLVALLDDEDAGMADSPGDGWPPIHAVELLTTLGTRESIEPMLRVLEESSWDEIIHDRIIVHLPKLGAPVLEPALAALGRATDDNDEDARHAVCCVLAELGVRDERVFRALFDLFEDDVSLGAMCFANYGDPRAQPLVLEAIETYEPDWDSRLPMIDLPDLVEAHERLGGDLPPAVQERVAGLYDEWDRRRARRAAATGRTRTGHKVGRNDACPCGSGKKYKKCCLGKVSAVI